MNDEQRKQQAKAVDIVAYLSSQGLTPARETSRTAYFLSPLRSESSPSFSVNKETNRFIDFGQYGVKGDIIDLVQHMHNVNMPQAIDMLVGEDRPVFKKPDRVIVEDAIDILDSEVPITHPYLVDYIERERHIPLTVAEKLLSQVTFQFKDKRYATHLAVGWKSDNSGWNLRSTWAKFTTRGSGITTVYMGDSDKYVLFEGGFDYLSWLTLGFWEDATIIVLNSVVYVDVLLSRLKKAKYVMSFLDNDPAGDERTEHMKKEGVTVVDMRHYFKGYKDYNEFLQNTYEF